MTAARTAARTPAAPPPPLRWCLHTEAGEMARGRAADAVCEAHGAGRTVVRRLHNVDAGQYRVRRAARTGRRAARGCGGQTWNVVARLRTVLHVFLDLEQHGVSLVVDLQDDCGIVLVLQTRRGRASTVREDGGRVHEQSAVVATAGAVSASSTEEGSRRAERARKAPRTDNSARASDTVALQRASVSEGAMTL